MIFVAYFNWKLDKNRKLDFTKIKNFGGKPKKVWKKFFYLGEK